MWCFLLLFFFFLLEIGGAFCLCEGRPGHQQGHRFSLFLLLCAVCLGAPQLGWFLCIWGPGCRGVKCQRGFLSLCLCFCLLGASSLVLWGLRFLRAERFRLPSSLAFHFFCCNDRGGALTIAAENGLLGAHEGSGHQLPSAAAEIICCMGGVLSVFS